MAGFNRRVRRLEFLAIDAAMEDFKIKGVVWKNAELRNRIADQIVGCLRGGQVQILERDLISLRTKEALSAKKADDQMLAKPKGTLRKK